MTLAKKIVIGFVTCFLILLAVAFFAIKSSERFVASTNWVDHTNHVLLEFEKIWTNTAEAESAERGFVITDNPIYAEKIKIANAASFEHLTTVKKLTADNPTQQVNLEALEKELNRHAEFFDRCIALGNINSLKARELVSSGEGKRIQEEIIKIIERSMEIESQLLKQRDKSSQSDAGNFNLVFAFLLIVISGILIVVYKIISTNLKALKESETETAEKNWLLTGNSELNELLNGEQTTSELASNTIGFMCAYLNANIGAVYLFNPKNSMLELSGNYAFSSNNPAKQSFGLNEGLVGQVAREKKQITITDIADDHMQVISSVMNTKPRHLLITPLLFEGNVIGVMEIGSLRFFSETEKEFISVSMGSIAISVNTALNQQSLRHLYEELARQAEEKERRAAELVLANKELAFQNNEKGNRAAELAIANKELAYQNDEKESRAAELIIANKELAYQNDEKESRAAELAIANKELAYQNDEKESRAAELIIANKELAYQNDEKESRAAELIIANKELAYQNDEKESRSAELVIANKELAYQNEEKEKRAAELAIANKELEHQNSEKEKRAAELVLANQELAYQAEELQTQQEELRQINEELEEQTQNLKQQQEELQMTNEELEEQTQSLEVKNKEVEGAKSDIEQKTKQLEISSRYKSEFLANMSHELRTPLNSLLILSKDLAENKKKNLDKIQVECAEIIYKSGHDLLVLINEVLDLSKIEAGKMNITIERVSLRSFIDNLIRNFKHTAEQKGLILSSSLDKGLPDSIRTDSQRLNQILKNLLSNAIKFTEKGSVDISIHRLTNLTLEIAVTDTGIGIDNTKLTAIFEAFQQADGGTSRKYGGTGLGLSISRELAKLLGAEIKVKSAIHGGSVFSIIMPLEIHAENESVQHEAPVSEVTFIPRDPNDTRFLNHPSIADDRNSVSTGSKVLLIVEDDLKFAAILLRQAQKKGFKCICASTGEDGLILAAKYKPQAIILDMDLPGIDGHQVLIELKANPAIRHIPVHVISAHERSLVPIREGAVEYLMKPIEKQDLEDALGRIETFVSRKIKNLLIIEDSENSRKAMRVLIGDNDVHCFEAGTGKEALALFKAHQIDCIILDIGLPDISGFDLIRQLEEIKNRAMPPIIVYTGKELTREENDELQKYAKSIIIKGVKSEERLLDETALFLHRTISNLPESKQMIIHSLYDKEAIFHNKKVLLVDDDARNVFALSKVLVERGIQIIKAENGLVALEMLARNADTDMVLMDIMMPEMDGYETMKRIRAQIKFKNLPVIALTAKAMKDDKQKCIDAGANEYITKPIDIDRLLSLMRVWLSK